MAPTSKRDAPARSSRGKRVLLFATRRDVRATIGDSESNKNQLETTMLVKNVIFTRINVIVSSFAGRRSTSSVQYDVSPSQKRSVYAGRPKTTAAMSVLRRSTNVFTSATAVAATLGHITPPPPLPPRADAEGVFVAIITRIIFNYTPTRTRIFGNDTKDRGIYYAK